MVILVILRSLTSIVGALTGGQGFRNIVLDCAQVSFSKADKYHFKKLPPL